MNFTMTAMAMVAIFDRGTILSMLNLHVAMTPHTRFQLLVYYHPEMLCFG